MLTSERWIAWTSRCPFVDAIWFKTALEWHWNRCETSIRRCLLQALPRESLYSDVRFIDLLAVIRRVKASPQDDKLLQEVDTLCNPRRNPC